MKQLVLYKGNKVILIQRTEIFKTQGAKLNIMHYDSSLPYNSVIHHATVITHTYMLCYQNEK